MRKPVTVAVGKTLNAVSHLGPSSLLFVVAQPTKDMQTEQLLCWSGMTDTEHIISDSNEEEHLRRFGPQTNNWVLSWVFSCRYGYAVIFKETSTVDCRT